MSIEIRDLDRHDEAQVRAWWEVQRDAVADRPYNFHPAWEAARELVPMDMTHVVRRVAAAYDGETMVGALLAWGPTTDNTHRAGAEISVLPGHRRRGVGTALVRAFEQWASDQGRRTLGGEVFAPVGGTSAGTAFAQRHGYRTVIEDGIKVVDIPATRGSWDGLATETAPHHEDHALRTVVGRLPDDLVEAYCVVNNMFMSEAPTGESEIEDEVWDEARVREQEERLGRTGRVDVRTFALGPEGDVAALTEAFVNEHTPTRGVQGGTLVVPAHRGHRLGLAVKVANHRALVEQFPALEWLVTGNADVNVHMNAINDRLGYRVVERCLEVEKSV